jgi:hypothetical protein
LEGLGSNTDIKHEQDFKQLTFFCIVV